MEEARWNEGAEAMARIPKRLTPVHLLPHRQLQIMFYQAYDEAYLHNKALALSFAIEEADRFKAHFDGRPGVEDGITDKAFDSLRAELYFTLMQGVESLFAILLSVFQDKPDWVYLGQYGPGDMTEKARLFLDSRIAELTGDEVDTPREFVSSALYAGFASADAGQRNRWNECLDNAIWLLRRVAQMYLDGTDEYNAFKHGMRVMLGPAGFKITPRDEAGGLSGRTFSVSSGDTLTFLDWTEMDDGKAQLYKVTKVFNPQEAGFYLSVMHRMLETIKKTRLARLQDATGAELNTFFDLNRQFVLSLSRSSKWRIPI